MTARGHSAETTRSFSVEQPTHERLRRPAANSKLIKHCTSHCTSHIHIHPSASTLLLLLPSSHSPSKPCYLHNVHLRCYSSSIARPSGSIRLSFLRRRCGCCYRYDLTFSPQRRLVPTLQLCLAILCSAVCLLLSPLVHCRSAVLVCSPPLHNI